MSDPTSLDINAIMRTLPHRYPFLLLDRVLHWERNRTIRAIKNVTYNEPFFTGHFPVRPVMPGVLVIEALAQLSGLLTFLSADLVPDENTRFYLAGVDKARFRAPVEPGDQLVLSSTIERNLRGIVRFSTTAMVADREVVEAVIMIAPDLKRGSPQSAQPEAQP